MTDPTFTCETFEAALPAWLDGTLAHDERERAERHRAGCAACAALVTDLEAIMTNARQLPDLEPSRDLWPDIEARIAPRVLELPARAATPAPALPLRRWLAAVALVTVSITGTWAVMRNRPGSAPAGEVAGGPGQPRTPRPVLVADGAARPGAAATLAAELDALERIVADREHQLDPETVRIVRENLAIIDRAIDEARRAMATEPDDALLDEQFTRVLGRKVELMRQAALLPSRT